MQRGRFVLALATAGFFTRNPCLVREVPAFCTTANSVSRRTSRSHGPHIGSGTEPAHGKSMGKEDILRYISSLKKASNLAIFLPKYEYALPHII